jgi:hypothetical protein
VSKLRKAESAKHSVPHDYRDKYAADRWVCAAFSGIFVAWSFSHFDGESQPTHQRVTHTVRWLLGYSRGWLKNFEL